ncbi:MAG: NnrU family protein [Roseicyclus sp.]
MGYILLIAGVALFAGAHWFKRLAPAQRLAMGDKGKGLVALIMLAGIILMVIGYRGAAFVNIWSPPAFLTHVNNLLMVLSFWLFALSADKGTFSARIRHKQLTGVKVWAVAHLLVNGDLASVILFAGLLAWAVVSVILINKAEPTWTRPTDVSVAGDIKALVIGVVIMAIVMGVHYWLGVSPFPT